MVGPLGRHQTSNCKGTVDIVAQNVDQEKADEDEGQSLVPKPEMRLDPI